MNSIFVATIIATAVILLFCLIFNYLKKYKIDLICIVIFILLLSMCYITYTFIRIPIDNIIKNIYHKKEGNMQIENKLHYNLSKTISIKKNFYLVDLHSEKRDGVRRLV